MYLLTNPYVAIGQKGEVNIECSTGCHCTFKEVNEHFECVYGLSNPHNLDL